MPPSNSAKFEIRAKAFENLSQKAIESLKEKYINLFVYFNGKYYLLYGMRGANPQMPPDCFNEYNYILLVEENLDSHDNIRHKVLKVLLGGKAATY